MYKEREILFNNPRIDWSKIQKLEYLLQPYYHIWIGLTRGLKDRHWKEIFFVLTEKKLITLDVRNENDMKNL